MHLAHVRAALQVPNRYGVMGGVEFGFSSTTLDRKQAEHYASSGLASTIFEMQMGMGERGCRCPAAEARA